MVVIGVEGRLKLLEHLSGRLMHQKQVDVFWCKPLFGNHLPDHLRDRTYGKTHQTRTVHIETASPSLSIARLDRAAAWSRSAIGNDQRVRPATIGSELKTADRLAFLGFDQSSRGGIAKNGFDRTVIVQNILGVRFRSDEQHPLALAARDQAFRHGKSIDIT